MLETVRSASFLWTMIICVSLSTALLYLVSRLYDVDAGSAKKLKVEPLLTACNTGITVAGIAIPLLAALYTYSRTQLSQSPSELAFLSASLLLAALSVLGGLWSSFSLVGSGGEQGILTIHKDSNPFIPAFLVLQLSLLFMSIFALGLYLLWGMPGIVAPVPQASPATGILLLRRPVQIGATDQPVQLATGS